MRSKGEDEARTKSREAERLQALREYGVLDSEREAEFDELVDLAARLCEVPIAVINLIDADRQWFKAEVGLGVRETPLETSFCRHALLEQDRLVVPDATLDPRFQCNPLVTGQPGLRFYAGVLLKGRDDHPIGTLCVLDTQARPGGLTDLQMKSLEVLARQVMSQLELRRLVLAGARSLAAHRATDIRREEKDALRDVADAKRDAHDVELARIALALADSESRFRAIADSMPQMVWSTLPDGFHDYYNARWYEFTGVPDGSTDGEAWNGMFHPDDQARSRARWQHSLTTGEPYEIEYRLRRHDGIYRWALGRAMPIRDETGRITRWFGTCTDIDDLKRMEQAKELLSQELSHRIKNIFAVVSALVALSARQHPEARAFATSLRTRISALARAHEFVRPHTETSRPTVGAMTLHSFLQSLFAAYLDDQGDARIEVTGDDTVFDDQAATSVALLFHELATNASKYGALSSDDGKVTLATTNHGDRFHFHWIESGGPPVEAAPERRGFGSSLAELSVEGQLGGELSQDWNPEGLRVFVDLPATALSRRRHALKSMSGIGHSA